MRELRDIFLKQVNFFPLGITRFFENIEKVNIYGGKLNEVTKDDLKQFGSKLEELELQQNDIEAIEGDLYEHNRNLRWINLRDNKIKRIGGGTFDGLEKLMFLYLDQNPCTKWDDNVYLDCNAALRLISKVEKSCGEEKESSTLKPHLATELP